MAIGGNATFTTHLVEETRSFNNNSGFVSSSSISKGSDTAGLDYGGAGGRGSSSFRKGGGGSHPTDAEIEHKHLMASNG